MGLAESASRQKSRSFEDMVWILLQGMKKGAARKPVTVRLLHGILDQPNGFGNLRIRWKFQGCQISLASTEPTKTFRVGYNQADFKEFLPRNHSQT